MCPSEHTDNRMMTRRRNGAQLALQHIIYISGPDIARECRRGTELVGDNFLFPITPYRNVIRTQQSKMFDRNWKRAKVSREAWLHDTPLEKWSLIGEEMKNTSRGFISPISKRHQHPTPWTVPSGENVLEVCGNIWPEFQTSLSVSRTPKAITHLVDKLRGQRWVAFDV